MASTSSPNVDLANRVDRLTAGQRECLDLVDDHATSKEIARQLGISRHTVDARLRGAIQTLGVTSRREAAVIYRAAMQAQAYQPFAYQPPQIASDAPKAETSVHVQPTGDHDRAHGADLHSQRRQPAYAEGRALDLVSESAVWTAMPQADFGQRRPFLRLWGGANDLNASQRMVGILVVMIVAMLAFGVFLSGIEALTLLRS